MNRPLVLFFGLDPVHKLLFNELAKRFGWDAIIVGTPFSEDPQDIHLVQLGIVDAIVMAIDGNEIHDFKRLQWLRRFTKNQSCYIPVLAATARALPEERERCMKAAVDAYLSKPFKAEDLRDTVIELIQRFPRENADLRG